MRSEEKGNGLVWMEIVEGGKEYVGLGGPEPGSELVVPTNKTLLMSTSIAARTLQLLELPTLLYQPGVHTNLEVTMLYRQVDAMDPLFFTTELAIDH